MKKWYVITGILALLWIISLGTCSINSGAADRAEQELAQLKATKEINFGNGLKVFDIKQSGDEVQGVPARLTMGYGVQGKVENVSGEPMQKVVIVVAFYNRDGQLDEDWGSVNTVTVTDLFPREVMEWEVHFGNWTDHQLGLFDVYAIGNKR